MLGQRRVAQVTITVGLGRRLHGGVPCLPCGMSLTVGRMRVRRFVIAGLGGNHTLSESCLRHIL